MVCFKVGGVLLFLCDARRYDKASLGSGLNAQAQNRLTANQG